MKYRFYWTDNENAYSRSEGDDAFNDDILDLENDREALKEVLYTQGQFDEDDEDNVERFENSSLAELKEWASEVDTGFGSPVVFWVKSRNGKSVYDSGLDPEDWNDNGLNEASKLLGNPLETPCIVQSYFKNSFKDKLVKRQYFSIN